MNNQLALKAAKRAAEIFLKRHLFVRQNDGSIIREEFTRLHYPLYWHYDILHALKVMAEPGFINTRCKRALDLLDQLKRPPGSAGEAATV